nr:NCS-like protein [synthetic construct]UUJ74938.1 NCS-like protein [Cephalotaxus hainanensis]
MVAKSITVEIDSPVEAKRFWAAIVKDYDLLPRQMPGVCSGVTLVKGDGGVGTIIQIDYTPVNKDFSYVKERVDEVDEGNFVYSFSYVEGGEVGTKWASAKFKMQLTPKTEGGCVLKHTCEYDTLPGIPLDEAKLEEMERSAAGLLKSIEAYLVSNPTVYC